MGNLSSYDLENPIVPLRLDSDFNAIRSQSFTSYVEELEEKKVELFDRLIELKKLPNNWDGYGAIAFDIITLQNAQLFIENLPDTFIEALTVEDVTPNPNATVTIEWTGGDDYLLSIEIGRDFATYFALLPNRQPIRNNHYVIPNKGMDQELLQALTELQKVSARCN
jgi:hypothetical protein